ncbi:MAG: type II-A CRISPR-associated protein Csn2, partial [Lachnospiraceae bacterium]
QILAYAEYPITYDKEIDVNGLLKLADIRVEVVYTGMMEKLVDYMKIMQDICNMSICILVNIKSYLGEDELKKIFQFAEYNKIHLLLIESVVKNRSSQEKVYIWDEDSCEIY